MVEIKRITYQSKLDETLKSLKKNHVNYKLISLIDDYGFVAACRIKLHMIIFRFQLNAANVERKTRLYSNVNY